VSRTVAFPWHPSSPPLPPVLLFTPPNTAITAVMVVLPATIIAIMAASPAITIAAAIINLSLFVGFLHYFE